MNWLIDIFLSVWYFIMRLFGFAPKDQSTTNSPETKKDEKPNTDTNTSGPNNATANTQMNNTSANTNNSSMTTQSDNTNANSKSNSSTNTNPSPPEPKKEEPKAQERTDFAVPGETPEQARERRFDKNAISEITGGADAALEIDLIDTFFKSTKDVLQQLSTALKDNDAHHAEIYSHSIKGAAKYVGAVTVANIAFDIERLSKDKKLDEAKEKMPQFVYEITETNKILEDYKSTLQI